MAGYAVREIDIMIKVKKPDDYLLDAEEGLVLDATELIAEAMVERECTRAELAQAIGMRKSWVTKRLRGKREMNLREFAAMMHVLGYDVRVTKHGHEENQWLPLNPPRTFGPMGRFAKCTNCGKQMYQHEWAEYNVDGTVDNCNFNEHMKEETTQ